MRRPRFIFGILLVAALGLAACGGGGQAGVEGGGGSSGPEATAPGGEPPAGETLPTAPPAPEIPETVPILAEPIDLQVTSNGTYITYQAATTVEEATKFYQEELAARGWEQKSRTDSGFGDSITLLRSHTEYNISVTIQSVAGSDNVKVAITLIPK